MSLVSEATDHFLTLVEQGKPLSDALSHAHHRYGVTRDQIKAEVVRRRSYPLCEPYEEMPTEELMKGYPTGVYVA